MSCAQVVTMQAVPAATLPGLREAAWLRAQGCCWLGLGLAVPWAWGCADIGSYVFSQSGEAVLWDVSAGLRNVLSLNLCSYWDGLLPFWLKKCWTP